MCLCVLCSPAAVLHTNPDKFKVPVSICDGSVIHRAHLACVCVCEREFILLMLALETIIAEIICFQG